MKVDERRTALLRCAIERTGPVAPTTSDWSEWAWLARVDRVVPLLFKLVGDASIELTDDQSLDLRELQGAAMCRVVQLEHHALAVSIMLQDRGIQHSLLKGATTAHLDHFQPTWREFSDIDLLVDPSSRAAVLEALEADGWAQGYALPRHHEDFTHAVTLVKDGMELDVHQRIAHRALGILAPTEELLANGISFQVAGVDVPALSDVDRLIHAALHSSTSGIPQQRRLSSLADVLAMAERRPELAGKVIERAARWRLRSIVSAELRIAYETAQMQLPAVWVEAESSASNKVDRLVDAAYLSPYRRPWLEELAYLRLLKGWRSRFRYVRGYLATDAEYAEQHSRSGLVAQVRYLGSKLRAGR